MESLKLGPRVKASKEENDSSNLILGPSLGDSITNHRGVARDFCCHTLYPEVTYANNRLHHNKLHFGVSQKYL